VECGSPLPPSKISKPDPLPPCVQRSPGTSSNVGAQRRRLTETAAAPFPVVRWAFTRIPEVIPLAKLVNASRQHTVAKATPTAENR
jgi:hypothetical protein